jgi:general secretion pathway protein D
VTIAEVTLNDELAYGVQFYLAGRLGEAFNTTGTATTGISPAAPGFNLLIGNQNSPRAILSALHTLTKVKILSNPSLVVVDNQEATLEVGDQVPVSTGSAVVLSANNAVVNTVDYKNTGIILHVQPRVNSDGNVQLDISQEISSVPTTNTGSLTPTISERKVKSELSVANGQTVLLAGLISETQNSTHSGIPVLDQLPVLGKAFGSDDNVLNRTELIIFIRPQVIRSGGDASAIAEELRSKMRGGTIRSMGGLDFFPPKPPQTLH